MAKSFTEIVEALKSYIRGKNPNIDTAEGTIVNDIVISAPSKELASLYETIENVSLEQSLETASDVGLEKIANNFGLTRKAAKRAIGNVVFFTSSTPSANINIPAGTIVSTPLSTGKAIRFTTTRSVVMYSNLSTLYLNPSTGYYEISTEIEAVEGGIDGIVGAGTINTIVTPVPGIKGVYNPSPTVGGSDIETLESFKARIAAALTGNMIGTEDGYLSIVLANNNVEDAAVAGHGNTSRGDMGAVDIFIKGQIPRYKIESFTTSALTFPNLVLSKQPVLKDGIVSIISSASGSMDTSLYTFTQDMGAYGGSIYGLDKIVWNSPISGSFGAITIGYYYNGLIEDLQNLFSKTNKDVLNTNLLIRWAKEIKINITANIKILPGYDSQDIKNKILTELQLFFNSLQIGAPVQQADVVRTILNVPGVDDVQLPLQVFESSDYSLSKNSFGDLDIPPYTYATSGTIIINIII